MRFKRADLPSIAIAALAPAVLFTLVVAALQLWRHEGTPLLSIIASTVAIGGGLLATLTQYVHHWRRVGIIAVLFVLDVAAVMVLQRTGNDWTLFALALKAGGAVLFLAAKGAIGWDVVDFGLLPILDRRAAARAARNAARA